MEYNKFFKPSLLLVLITLVLITDVRANSDIRVSVRDIQELLRHRIEAQPVETGELEVMGTFLYSRRSLPQFYIETGFQPLWVGENLANAYRMRQVILESFNHGMNPALYHIEEIDSILPPSHERANINRLDIHERVDLELLLTDAFMILASHHLGGQLDPASLDPQWRIARQEADYVNLLHQIRDGARPDVLIRAQYPNHEGYHRLVGALAYYRYLHREGGWDELPAGATLRRGDRDARVVNLRNRLHLAGDFLSTNLESDEFDEELHQAVIRFQRRHGLTPDGIVGPRSLQALNTTVEKRLEQTIINLERWRWLQQDLGSRHIKVNIANFFVEVVEDDEVVMEMRAIVGRQFRQTPVFSARMTYLVLSPFWHLPPGISRNDILPRLKNDPRYAIEQNIKVFDGWGSDAREIDPLTVDWNAISPTNLRYRFRQDPGPNNALGDVKFMFPNPFHVYLHDTPARGLFDQTVRDFSSGCIRIERPKELAEYLLRDNQGWDKDAIQRAIDRRVERSVTLARAIPVHILYWTAWADPDGTIHFRDDIYNRDTALLNAITSRLQTPLTRL